MRRTKKWQGRGTTSPDKKAIHSDDAVNVARTFTGDQSAQKGLTHASSVGGQVIMQLRLGTGDHVCGAQDTYG